MRDEDASRAAYGAVLRERARLRCVRRPGVGLVLAAAALLAVALLWRPFAPSRRRRRRCSWRCSTTPAATLALDGVVRGGPEAPALPRRGVLVEVAADAETASRACCWSTRAA